MSWDDGHPSDRRLADLLASYGFRATFFIPTFNCEGRKVMAAGDIQAIAGEFEVGGHTVDHVALRGMLSDTLWSQVRDNKAWLEQTTGTPVHGFCYPRGCYDAAAVRTVRRAGFAYARTVRNFCARHPQNRFAVPTTLQFFPHHRSVYLRNFVRCPFPPERARLLSVALNHGDLTARLVALAEVCARARRGVFHVWGHSWELDELGLWPALADFLCRLNRAFPDSPRLTNSETVERLPVA